LYEYRDHLQAAQPIAESLGDEALLGHLHACRGHIQYMLGHAKDAATTLQAAIELCERAGNMRGAAHAYAHLQWVRLQRGEYEDALMLEASSLRALAQAPDMRLWVYALTGSAYACAMLGRWSLGLKKGHQALQESERARDLSLVCFSYTFGLTIVYLQQGATDMAIECGRRAVESSQTPAERQWAEVFYGWALAPKDPAAAVELLEPVAAFYRAARLDWQDCFASVPLGEACCLAGRMEQARESLEHTVDLGGRLGIRLFSASAQRLLGEVMLAEGTSEALAKAQYHFEGAMRSLAESKAENELALAWVGYGKLQLLLDRPKMAREYLSKALATFERLGTVAQPERVRAELAALVP